MKKEKNEEKLPETIVLNKDSEKHEFPREYLSIIARRMQDLNELLPTRLPSGGFNYVDIDELKLKADTKELLEYMFKNEYLVRIPYETIMVCPNCDHTNIAPILKCKSCNSLSVHRERLIEHKAGGHIHPESSFEIIGEKLKCPSCSRLLNQTDRRTIGAWFICSDCKERQTKITPEYKCLDDGKIFSPVMAEYDTLYKYLLSEKAKALLGLDKSSIMNNIVQLLETNGKVSQPFLLKGKSGVEHEFDLLCDYDNKQLIIDVEFDSKPLDDQVVLASFAKTFEIKDDIYLLITWPGLTKSATNLVNFYKINLIQSTNLEDLTKDLNQFLETKLKKVKGV